MKGVTKKDTERTLCFEVDPGANKVMVKAAVEHLFKVKVADVRTVSHVGKLRRRGWGTRWGRAHRRLAGKSGDPGGIDPNAAQYGGDGKISAPPSSLGGFGTVFKACCR